MSGHSGANIIDMLTDELRVMSLQKDSAYSERNKLVALISKIFPSYLGLHEVSDSSWDSEWKNIVYVELPTGQCSWHIHDSEMGMFSHLKFNNNIKWDGHSTELKYSRIEAYAKPEKIDCYISTYEDKYNLRFTC